MLTLFHKDGRLDSNNITVCQFNVEFHWPYRNSLKEFGVFILDILRDRRYVILNGFYTEWREDKIRYHVMRFYGFNIESPICKSRYLRKKNHEEVR
uniref:Galectin domain-containing protein n=1 Tax=Ascaris lumbricoides TaxID=6252 RepID=A0A0M3IGW3_ASCLU